jgi:hypothetical protein
MLGQQSGRRVVRTPELVADGEVTRVMAKPVDRIEVDDDSAWSHLDQ